MSRQENALSQLRPEGCGEGRGVTPTEEGPPAGAGGVGGHQPGLRPATAGRGWGTRKDPVSRSLSSTPQCQVGASHQEARRPGGPGSVLHGGRPPRAGEGQRVPPHSIGDRRRTWLSVVAIRTSGLRFLNILHTQTPLIHSLASLKRVQTLLENRYLQPPQGGAACPPAAPSEPGFCRPQGQALVTHGPSACSGPLSCNTWL